MSPVVWTDGRFTALNKPAGIPVFPPHKDLEGDCLLQRWLAEDPSRTADAWPPGFSGGIAHRLDVASSGQVLASVHLADLPALRALFSEGHLDKAYQFISAGDVPWDDHVIEARIAHHPKRRKRMVVERGQATPHRGKWYRADTRLRRVGPVGEGLWCWEAIITTGVMHQIRVHAGSVGLALHGDRLYGGGSPPPGRPVPFLLHHLGLTGPDLTPPTIPVPDFWPTTP